MLASVTQQLNFSSFAVSAMLRASFLWMKRVFAVVVKQAKGYKNTDKKKF